MSDHHAYLARLLDETREHVRRFVVVDKVELDAIALWNAHTYVFDLGRSSPYLHPYSPEPGSGKTTLLEVLEQTARNAIEADGMSEAALFRLIDLKRPTLLIDEVDAIFGKRNSDSTEGIRQVLNSGYRKGRQVWRCVPPSHEVRAFDVFCPKATAGLNELPGTLAHRSIPISMKPPRHEDVFEDFDPEATETDTETLRMNLQSWADESLDVLRDPRLKPARLAGLDARGNEIWRMLFRIADQAGGEWRERARAAAVELSGRDRHQQEASTAVRLLGHIRDLFTAERMWCAQVIEVLNDDEEQPYGGWSEGKGISTRELGKKLAPYGIKAKTIRIGENTAKGYERTQFEDAWSRYLRAVDDSKRHTDTTRMAKPDSADFKETQIPFVSLSEHAANPVVPTVVPLVPLSNTEHGFGPPLIGDPGYALFIDGALTNGHLTEAEHREQFDLSTLVYRQRAAAANA